MNRVEEISVEIVKELISSGFEEDAQELNKLTSNLVQEGDQTKRSQLKKEIIERTHIKWLGDLSVRNLKYKDWWKLLEKLKKAVQKVS